MGQFKPMVKMMTTEPSVILKLKKGGHVAMPKGKGGDDFKSMRSTMKEREVAEPPMRRSNPPRQIVSAPAPGALTTPMMKRGGRACMAEGGETPAMHRAEMKKMGKVEKELKSHESKPASKAHAGLKTGGVVKGQAGYKTGGVANAQGGYRMGGAAKKYARGGEVVVDDGKAEKMPQGRKKPSAPVRINELSGSFKRGGKIVKKADGGALGGRSMTSEAERRAMESAISPDAMEQMKRIAEEARQDMETERGYARATGRPVMRPGSVTDYEKRSSQEAGRTVVPMGRKKGGKC